MYIALFACDNPIIDDIIEQLEPLQTGEIRIKAWPGEDNQFSFIIVSEKIFIDWGDGTTEEHTPNGLPEGFIHEYTDHNQKCITIRTEEMSAFGAFNLVNSSMGVLQTFGRLEEINFGKCPQLEEVILRGNDLVRLEMEEVNILTLLDCSYNNLSATVLNNLFSTLPFSKEGIIIFRQNEGSTTCDANIFLSKGWTEHTLLPDEEIVAYPIDDESIIGIAKNIFSGFGNLLKQVYLFEGLYSQTIKLENFNGFGNYSNLYNHQLNSANLYVLEMWSLSYNTIRNFSGVLYMMLNSDINVFSNYIHTVKVLRSYAYFNMINYWGDVPYIDERLYNNIQDVVIINRMNKDQLLNLLITQLLEAESALPETETENVLSKHYARLILAKIYTYQENYTKALEYTMKIIESGKFALSPDYLDIFENIDNMEFLTQFRTIYNSADKSWEELIKKGKHTPFSRYAEVILLASEIYLKSGNMQKSIDYLNQIRSRNNRIPATINLSVSAIEDLILEEYLQDMGNEGLYFFALKRFGKAEKTLGIEPFRLLLPIPLSEINRNPSFTQNEGY